MSGRKNTYWDDSYSVLSSVTFSTAGSGGKNNPLRGVAAKSTSVKAKKTDYGSTAASTSSNTKKTPLFGGGESKKADEKAPSSVRSPVFEDLPKAGAKDGQQVLASNSTFQRGYDEKVHRDIRDNLLPHSIARTVDEERRQTERVSPGKQALLPTLFRDTNTGDACDTTQQGTGEQKTDKDLETSNMDSLCEEDPLISEQMKPTPEAGLQEMEHKAEESSLSLLQFYRFFLNRHTLFAKLEKSGSWAVFLSLFLPIILCLALAFALSESKYDTVLLSSSSLCGESVSNGPCVEWHRDAAGDRLQVLLRFSPADYLVSSPSVLDSESAQRRFTLYNMSPSLLCDVNVLAAARPAERIEANVEAYTVFDDAVSPQGHWQKTIFSAAFAQPMREEVNAHQLLLPVIDTQSHELRISDAIFFNISLSLTTQDRSRALQESSEDVRIAEMQRPFEIELRLRVLSGVHMYRSACVYLALCVVSTILLAVFCVRVFSNAKVLHLSFAQHLPFIYATIFSQRHFVLPEQYAVMSALYCLMFALNPLQAGATVAQFHFGEKELSPLLAFAADFMSACAFFAGYAVIVWFVEGLHFHKNKFETTRAMHTLRDLEGGRGFRPFASALPSEHAPPCTLNSFCSAHSGESSSANFLQQRVLTIVENVHNTYILPHHPCSAQFLEFSLFKVLLLLVSWTSAGLYLCSVHRVLLFNRLTAAHDENFSLFCKVTIVALNAVWCLWVLKAFSETGQTLRALKYIPTRLRQLTFRLLSFQFVLAVLASICAAYYCVTLLSSENDATNYRVWMRVWSLVGLGLTQDYVGVFDVSYSLVYSAIVVFLLTHSLSPLSLCSKSEETQEVGETQMFLAMKREFDERTLRVADARRLPFCLELSCFLLEASYQTYFSADERLIEQEVSLHPMLDFTSYQNTPSGPSLDLARLGMKLRDVFFNDYWSTFGYLSEVCHSDRAAVDEPHRDEFVVSFRGSTLANITTDLKFTQIPLPALHGADHTGRFLHFLSNAAGSAGPLSEEIPFSSVNCAETIKEECIASLHGCLDDIPLLNQSFPRVHAGFWEAYASLREQYLYSITNALYHHYEQSLQQLMLDSFSNADMAASDYSHLGCRVFLCGHSLGGAMAVLAALELALNMESILEAVFARLKEVHHLEEQDPSDGEQSAPQKDSEAGSDSNDPNVYVFHGFRFHKPTLLVYAFGCPRVGNATFARLFDEHVKTCYRINVDGDLVTTIPKFFGFYRHVGVSALIDEEGKGDLIMNPSVIEQSLLRRSVGNISNHRLDKYRSALETCFEPEDLHDYLQREKMGFIGAR